jgi:hypothetical protein|tara:strand:- start:402 stop:539 length:138 start_codon:yes stop_codon:yes gene_type:complete
MICQRQQKELIKLCENYTISDLSETAEDLTEVWMKKINHEKIQVD